jgi:hypothetical protein
MIFQLRVDAMLRILSCMGITCWTKFPGREYLGMSHFLLVFRSKLGTLGNGTPFGFPPRDLTHNALLEKTMSDFKAFIDDLAQRPQPMSVPLALVSNVDNADKNVVSLLPPLHPLRTWMPSSLL